MLNYACREQRLKLGILVVLFLICQSVILISVTCRYIMVLAILPNPYVIC